MPPDGALCVECGAPFRWRAPSPVTGREQGWNRLAVESPKGWRCEQREACRRRRAESAPSLF